MKIVLLGAPGAGKGTHATRLSDDYGIPHISTGDIFRANLKNGTELGLKAKSYMDQGLLVPDELTVDLVLDRLKQDDCRNGWILDGFPRNLFQAEALTKAMADEGGIDYAIHLTIEDEQIVKRTWLEKLQTAIADGLKALCAEGEEPPKKCADKLAEMHKRLVDTGFTSFWA